jgi:alkanesulfonate monooxygenase SsuD/methylene tetrahydromethanopterin reductase-like flavin-dependent oxidoreductase (luciferase family)
MTTWPSEQKLADRMWEWNLQSLQALRGRYDTVWMADHLVPAQSWLDPTLPTLEAWTALTYLAGAFPNYRFGHGVLNNSLRWPAWLAKAAATAQHMSGGRLILGIGAGQSPGENHAYGYEYGSNAVRIGQLGEAVQIIRKLWTESPATFHGTYYQINEAYCSPQPTPPPPILIGGGGERYTLPIVARHADWWNMTAVPAEVYAQKLDVLRRCCDAIGRDPASITLTVTIRALSIARSQTEARRIYDESAFSKAPPSNNIVGTPEMIVEQLQPFLKLGITHIILANFADYPSTDGAMQFADEVVPLIQ